MANYANGARFEYGVRNYFQRLGYSVVRSAGSRGVVDLIAFNDHHAILIQCKKERKSGGSYEAAMAALRDMRVPQGWKKYLFVKRTSNKVTMYDIATGGMATYAVGEFQ